MTAPPATPTRSRDLSVSFAGIQLKNPVIAASGTFGYGIEFEDIVHLNKLGGFVVKGLSKEPMPRDYPRSRCRAIRRRGFMRLPRAC